MKIWGRTTSSNVQKVMWAVGEMGIKHERIEFHRHPSAVRICA